MAGAVLGHESRKDKSAAEQRERQQTQQAQAQQSRQRNQNIGGLLMLGIILGAMDGGSAEHDSRSSVVCPGDPNNHSGLCNP